MAVRFIIPGTRVYSSGQQLFPDGSIGAPSIAFKNTPTTGLSLTGGATLLMSVLGFAAFNVASVADGIRIANTYSLGWTPAGANSNAPDLRLFRDAANTLAQRNGANAQEFRVYNTDNGSDDEFLSIGTINAANEFRIEPEATGSGTVRGLNVCASAGSLSFYAGTPVARQTGVAISAAGIHAALVSLNLITA